MELPGRRFIGNDVVAKNFKTGTTADRISVFRFAKSNLKQKMFNVKTIGQIFLILSRIGSVSKWGNVYLVCINNRGYCKRRIPFALKIQNPKSLKTKRCKPLNTSDLGTELFFLRVSNYLVSWELCVHFPLTPQMFVVPGKKIQTARDHKYIVENRNCDLVGIISEWADGGDIREWTKNGITFENGIQLITQVLMSLYTLNYIIGYHHNDIHEGNVLINTMAQPRTFLYNVYYGTRPVHIRIHNCTFLSRLWDFSYANVIHIHKLPGFRNQKNLIWKSDPDQFLKVIGGNRRYRTIQGVVRKLRNIYTQSKDFVAFFNYAIYFLESQSPSITVDRDDRRYDGDRTAIISTIKPLTKRQKEVIFKKKPKSMAKQRLKRMISRHSR